jgi:hypothetical protein
MLCAEIVMNLLFKLSVGIDFVRHKLYLAGSSCGRGKSFGWATVSWRHKHGRRNALRKAARICLKRALHLARRMDLRV